MAVTIKSFTTAMASVTAQTKQKNEEPLSDFARQVLSDHPGLSVAEAKVVALTLLRCADYAANQSLVSVASRPVSG